MPAGAPRRILVVGAGVAGATCAFALRHRGFTGALTLVGAEPALPYDRTRLSKDVLAGSLGSLALRERSEYEEHSIELRLGTRVVRVDPALRRVVVADGAELTYDRLVLCTGGTPRLPAALDAGGVLRLRSLADAGAVARVLATARRVVVIGASFLGGEIATQARAQGVEVMLVDELGWPMARTLGGRVGERMAALALRAGVDLRMGVTVRAVRRKGSRFVVDVHGSRVLADAVIVAAGMEPDVRCIGDSAITVDRGIVTDDLCRTTAPEVFAAGDCARWWSARVHRLMHVEHWDTARRHGLAAAASVLGEGEPFSPVPFFWSDQYGVKLQLVGDPADHDAVQVSEPDSAGAFVARYLRDGRLLAALAVDRPGAIADARRELAKDSEEALALARVG